MNHNTKDYLRYASFGVYSYHSTPFVAEGNVRKASIASLILDWKQQAFALRMLLNPQLVEGLILIKYVETHLGLTLDTKIYLRISAHLHYLTILESSKIEVTVPGSIAFLIIKIVSLQHST
ncbi:hypothetical protein TNCV_1287341 [Trichonephila clavipes]|nr:hypothetical protein TNCV_1287341 [Trichonephila clavipes]